MTRGYYQEPNRMGNPHNLCADKSFSNRQVVVWIFIVASCRCPSPPWRWTIERESTKQPRQRAAIRQSLLLWRQATPQVLRLLLSTYLQPFHLKINQQSCQQVTTNRMNSTRCERNTVSVIIKWRSKRPSRWRVVPCLRRSKPNAKNSWHEHSLQPVNMPK